MPILKMKTRPKCIGSIPKEIATGIRSGERISIGALPSIRQILERLFDFIVFQFDTSSKRKKAGAFDSSKAPALPI